MTERAAAHPAAARRRLSASAIFGYWKIKISSIGASTVFEISIVSFKDGLYCAFSNYMMVSRRTPTICANCSCVNPFSCLYFLTYIQIQLFLFPRCSLLVHRGHKRYNKYSKRKILNANTRDNIMMAAIRAYARLLNNIPWQRIIRDERRMENGLALLTQEC